MRKGKKLAAVLLSAAMVLSSLQLSGWKKTAQAADFVDYDAETITENMGAGWNLGNQLESVRTWGTTTPIPDETAYGNPTITKELIDAVKKEGFKTVRIPVSYLGMIGDEKEGYAIDSSWLDRVEEVVGYVLENDMYAVINIHADGYSTVKGGWLLSDSSDRKQEQIKEKFKACWEQIAARFKDYSEKLIFESMNEVGADADAGNAEEVAANYKNINDYNQIFVDAVRQSGGNNDRRWLLIPGINTNAGLTTEANGFRLPTDQYRSSTIPENEQRIMVSVHYYSPWDFCGIEDYTVTQWGLEALDESRAATDALEGGMEQAFATLGNDFVKRGYPVVIGEYGSVDKTQIKVEDISSGKFRQEDVDATNIKYRSYYAEVLNVMAKRYGCIPVYWDNGYNGAFGFGLFNRNTCEVTQPEIIQAIMKVYKTGSAAVRDIKLDKSFLRICMGDDNVQLTATVTPRTAAGNVIWESADPSIAAVSQRGTVVPKKVGTTVITATIGEKQAYCIVHIAPAERFRAKLYYNSVAGSWGYATIASKDHVSVEASQSGTYTLKLTGSKDRMLKINTLYLKDVLGNDGHIENSIISKAKVKIDSFKMNDFEATMSKDEFLFDASKEDKNGKINPIFDICLINVWDETYVNEYTPNSNGVGGRFPDEAYVDGINTITLTFTLSDVEESSNRVKEIAPTAMEISNESVSLAPGAQVDLTAQLQPEDTTYKAVWVSDNPNIAKVSLSGKVTGVSEGTTTLHAFTGNELEKTCTVTVLSATEVMEVLRTAVAEAEGLKEADYTEDSYSKLKEALQAAKALIDSSSQDSSEIASVQSDLESAILHLLKRETFDSVKNLLDESLKEVDYTEGSWTLYKEQLELAQSQFAEGNLTQEMLEELLEKMNGVRQGLLTKATQTAMSDAIEGAKKYQSAEYTPESWKALDDALKAAEAAYADASVGEDQLQQLLAALQAAVSGLKKVGTDLGPSAQPPAVNNTQAPEPTANADVSKVEGKKMTLSKVTSPKKKTVQISWKKLSGASGYEIYLGTDKKISKGKKKVTVKKASATKVTVKNLKPGKKYFVKIRAYQTVSGKKKYSKWSAVKSVKVKK